MKLLKDYKLIYSAIRDGKLGIYATKDFPSEDDAKLTFVNKEGKELTEEELKAIKLVYVKDGSLCYSLENIPTEDAGSLYAYSNGELVYGDEETAPDIDPEPEPDPEPDPEPEVPAEWDLVKDKDSWDAAFADENSALRKYYDYYDTANFPYQEDLWNTVENRAASGLDIQTEDGKAPWDGGVPVVDENGHSIYTNCVRCWKGAVNAPGAAYPWAVVAPEAGFEGKIRFNYKDEEAVYPWGDEDKKFTRGFAIASIPNELGKPELKVNEAGEAELAINKEDLVITLVRK